MNRFAEDEDLAGRVDDLTTGSLRVLALPTTVEPMTIPDCRAAVAAVVDQVVNVNVQRLSDPQAVEGQQVHQRA